MTRKLRTETAKLLRRLMDDPASRLIAAEKGYALCGPTGETSLPVPASFVRALLGSGLLREAEPGRIGATELAQAWLRRQADREHGFRLQHHAIEAQQVEGESVLVNAQESPVAALARRSGRNGGAWLAPHAVAAAERLRRDFEVGQLQPRVTSNWSAAVNSGRRTGPDSGLTDLTDAALAARLRVDRAVHAVGPELAGVLLDVCCFLKGLETVERERLWPARSAKLVLRLSLETLARHYGLRPDARGNASGDGIRHWGAEGYRPELGGSRESAVGSRQSAIGSRQ